jgi:hypothetical protein
MHRVALALVLACASVLYLNFAWTDQLVSLGGDSAVYLLTAQHFAGIDPALTAEFAARSFYPPLYPLALAAFGGARDLVAANLITTIFLLLAMAALHAYARMSELGPWTSLLVVTLFAASPGSYLQTVMTQSENLYVLLSIAALGFGAAHARSGQNSLLTGLAVCTALAAMTRSAGVAMFAAILVRAIAVRSGPLLLAGVAAAIPAIAWRLLHPGDAGYGTQLALTVSGLLEFVLAQLSVWIRLWPSNFGVSTSGIAVLWMVTAFGLVGAAVRALRWHLDGLYSCAYLAMCLLWPFPVEAQRLLFVIMPVLLVQSAWLVNFAMALLPSRAESYAKAVPAACIGALLISVLPGAALAIGRYRQAPSDLERYRHMPEWYAGRHGPEDFRARDLLVDSIRDVAAKVSTGDCVYSVKPSLVAFHSRRMSYPPPPEATDDNGFRAALGEKRCRYFLMMGSTPSYPPFFYPLDRLKDEIEILALYSVPREDGSQRHVAALARWRQEK